MSGTEAHSGWHEGFEFEFNLGRAHRLASVQPREKLLDRSLRLIFAKRADEAVENMLARQGMADFGFLVVILQLGETNDAVLPLYVVSL